MDEASAVHVRGLRKGYGGRTVVDGVDLDVAAGQVVGLIGANGAGKTTTVECVQGLRRPDAGTLRVFGLDPAARRDRVRSLVGSQLQDSALPDRLRVAEAVSLFGGGDGGGLLEEFGLAARRRSAFASLSGGERQRLFLVLALLNRPRLVILDELTQGLDPAARRTVWAAVDRLRRDGIAVLLVTHELEDAQALCDSITVMNAGRVVDHGSPAELVERHGRRATISFTGPLGAGWSSERLAGLPGVDGVERAGDRMTVRGDRIAIAHVGAALVDGGRVPGDLSVQVPTLEDALLSLLQQTEGGAPRARSESGSESKLDDDLVRTPR
ncbi:MAG TPA: ABC transporter ATP-binding protein [Actinocrinis sp.]|jgi:ABC-2 type transport system ATP-binding protein